MIRVLFRIVTGVLSAYAIVVFCWIFWWLRILQDVWLFVLISWLIGWTILELITKKSSSPRLLAHFRYAPLATFIFFLVTVIAYDQVLILRSRSAIRQYMHSNASPEASPSLALYNNHRGWCGNGHSAAIYALYADVAAEGFESSDPAVRARSLRASIEVYDSWNGVTDGPFPHLIERADNDPDPLVRRIAADFRVAVYGFDR